jgi:ATP-dependent Lon protease
LIPKDNAKEIPELPERVREDLDIIPVSHLDEVLASALLEPAGQPIKLAENSKTTQDVVIPPISVDGTNGIIHVSGD